MSLRSRSGRSSVICCATISADREPEKIDFVNPRPSMNASAFFAMPAKGSSALRPVELADTRIIEEMTSRLLASRPEPQDPSCQISGEVLVKHKGQNRFACPAPISEANAVGLNKLSGNCRRCIGTHCLVSLVMIDDRFFGCQSSAAVFDVTRMQWQKSAFDAYSPM